MAFRSWPLSGFVNPLNIHIWVEINLPRRTKMLVKILEKIIVESIFGFIFTPMRKKCENK